MRKLLNNIKGFAMAELLAVSIVVLLIFSVLFSNYLPLVAEYENRLSYNDVTAQYAAHYVRKMYKEKLESEGENGPTLNFINETLKDNGYFTVYDANSNPKKNEICTSHVLAGDKKDCENLIHEYGIEEIIITKYTLKEKDGETEPGVKTKYEKNSGVLYNYIKYLPNYEKSIYTGKENGDQLYRIILKTTDYGYATTPILSDYSTPTNCFELVYNNEKNGFIITGYKGVNESCPANVIIKDKNVTSGGQTAKIVAIGDDAFSKNEDSKKIESITLSKNIESIGDRAFKGTLLGSFGFTTGVTEVGKEAFSNTKITEIEIPAGVTFGSGAFSKNSQLSVIKLGSISGDILDKNGNVTDSLFAECGSDTAKIAVTIPKNMKNIGEKMFYLSNVDSINFESNSILEMIGDSAFEQSDRNKTIKIDNLSLPISLKEIGSSSFQYLGINNVTFNGENLTTINGNAFANIVVGGSNGIGVFNVPSSVKTIANSAFKKSGITSLDFGVMPSIESIGDYAFSENKITELLTIPESITLINAGVFSSNPLTNGVKLPTELIIIGDGAFRNTELTSVEIPGSVTKIISSAFNSCSKLEEVKFLEGTAGLAIQNNAFMDNGNLSEIEIPARVTVIGTNVFNGCSKLIEITNNSSANFNWCDIFYKNPDNPAVCNLSYEGNKTYIDYGNMARKTITNMGGV